MRRLLFLLFLWPLLLTAQQTVNLTDDQGLRQGPWQRSYPNGRLMYEGTFLNDKPVGEWRRYHENGQLRAVLVHGSSDSVRARLFDERARLVAEGMYLGEKKLGIWKYYSDDRLISEETFEDGVKLGKARLFYADGRVLEESEWQNGLRHGAYRALFPSGNPFLECVYRNGMRNGFCISYFPSGSMEVDAFYSDDLPDGEWKYYTEQGQIRYTLQYSKGVLLNPEVLYELETSQLEELEKKGRQIADPEKFLNDPMEYLQKNP
jgi:antitoxin component YwqK of YwqJK toxin-antitoxin module